MIRFIPFLLIGAVMLLAAVMLGSGAGGRPRPGDPNRYRPRKGFGRGSDPEGAHFEEEAPFADQDATAPADPNAPADAPTDFFTGAPLDPDAGVVRCDDCRALYHPDTVALLAEHNGSRCVSCGGRSLRPLSGAELRRETRATAASTADRNPSALVPEPVGEAAYQQALGRLVTLSGSVVSRVTARGEWPSLLLRDAQGTVVRLVFVAQAGRGLKGQAFANSLLGSQVRLRGLLLVDEAHGFRLLVADTAMVLETRG